MKSKEKTAEGDWRKAHRKSSFLLMTTRSFQMEEWTPIWVRRCSASAAPPTNPSLLSLPPSPTEEMLSPALPSSVCAPSSAPYFLCHLNLPHFPFLLSPRNLLTAFFFFLLLTHPYMCLTPVNQRHVALMETRPNPPPTTTTTSLFSADLLLYNL